MQITVDLPDWALKDTLYIVSGDIAENPVCLELVASKKPDGNWMVKDQRCKRCGLCCDTWANSADPKVYPCENHVRDENGISTCQLGNQMPFWCVATNGQPYIPECSVTYKESLT